MKEQPQKAHVAVLLEEVLGWMRVQEPGIYVDGTVGSGGHARAILSRGHPQCRVLGIDWDPEALRRAAESLKAFGERVRLVEGNYAELERILREQGISSVRGVLLDLGASYEQLTSGRRGFSIYSEGPLDMRYSPKTPKTASEIINKWREPDLRNLFRTLGEEPLAGPIASAIVRRRPILSTVDLARLVEAVTRRRGKRIHPATRVFQALRMEVNGELENVERGIRQAAALLEEGGRLCVIAYHSLEDRLVKHLFRELAGPGGPCEILTAKPVRPAEEEVHRNPRARSARLRVLQRRESCSAS